MRTARLEKVCKTLPWLFFSTNPHALTVTLHPNWAPSRIKLDLHSKQKWSWPLGAPGVWAEAVIEMTSYTISHRSQTPPWWGLVWGDGKPFPSLKSEWQRQADWLRKLYFIPLIRKWKIMGMSCRTKLWSLLWWQSQSRRNTAAGQVLWAACRSWATTDLLCGLARLLRAACRWHRIPYA